ncbi:hypothetical protein WR25_04487 [Diploscapter pachys]|uniref:Guanine nucleotide-binding protein subunit gamma n=1 Tax=Diploscapter pachys TaxID=2018661 RepID=A0A2A2LFN3_9BILA|nr:hypothetical protein WR25_19303 isoform A [Diploscapter pachys]PAV65376.1 hypothetical protein WR25_19303 isoform B [Diploscapter pachys]PAV85046.1 hypothetical protein WR25_04487 [Diploscapter pachys]
MSSRDQTIQAMRKQIDQLRNERNMKRMPISVTTAEILKYTQDNAREDVLLTGFPNDKMNPYRPKSSFQCNLI